MKEKYCCEYWSEVDSESDTGISIGTEWCSIRREQCSCSGTKVECNFGMFVPQIGSEDEDR